MPESGASLITGVIPQTFLVEALGGPANPTALLDRFPEALYLKSPESHLVRFMYALLGPAGVGQVAKNYLEARLKLEELGIELFDLDRFYGDPLSFGRLLEETYDDDLTGLSTTEAQERINARDAAYRSRALDFIGGARLGNSPAGMRLVAKSGLGHDVEIVENYKYLYDQHADDTQGFTYYGQTTATEEMVVLPRREVSQTEIQKMTLYGSPSSGYVTPIINGKTDDNRTYRNIPWNAPAVGSYDRTDPLNPVLLTVGVQEVIESHSDVGKGNVRCTGGPFPNNPIFIEFIGQLANKDVPQIEFYTTADTDPSRTLGPINTLPGFTATVETIRGGVDASDEVANLSARDKYHLQQALDRIRPVNTIPTVNTGVGRRSTQAINSVYATSQFVEVTRFVTGSPGVRWPAVDATNWIVKGVETQAPRAMNTQQQHYQGFHDVAAVYTYSQDALTDGSAYESDVSHVLGFKSEHIGRFGPQASAYPALLNTDSDLVFAADRALADYPEQPVITATSPTGVALVNGVYPISYSGLSGVPTVRYRDEQFWSSPERISGTDYVEIDLGTVQMVNFIGFECLRKPIYITISFDYLDQAPQRRFALVEPLPNLSFPDSLAYVANSGWTYLEFNFADVTGKPIYTRFLRIALSRRPTDDFLIDPRTGTASPWSVEVRNLRVGRNVSN